MVAFVFLFYIFHQRNKDYKLVVSLRLFLHRLISGFRPIPSRLSFICLASLSANTKSRGYFTRHLHFVMGPVVPRPGSASGREGASTRYVMPISFVIREAQQ